MKDFLVLLCALMAAAVIAACIFLPSWASAAPVVGLNTQNYNPLIMDDAGKGYIAELKPQSIRLQFSTTYPVEPHIEWAASRGIGVMLFAYASGCGPTTAAGRQCYADRFASFARTYGGKIQYYEVWNEWNGGLGLGKYPGCLPYCADGSLYTDLLCRTYKAVKAVRPEAKVVGGATAGVDLDFLTKMLNAGAAKCMDAISVHPYVYGRPGPASSPKPFWVEHTDDANLAVDAFVKSMAAVDTLVRSKNGGKSLPVIASEEGRTDYGKPEHELLTAQYVEALYGRSMPLVEAIYWFASEDEPQNQMGWGLWRPNMTKKAAYSEFMAVTPDGPVVTPPPIEPPIPPVNTMSCDGQVTVTPSGPGAAIVLCEQASKSGLILRPPPQKIGGQTGPDFRRSIQAISECERDNLRMGLKKPCPTN